MKTRIFRRLNSTFSMAALTVMCLANSSSHAADVDVDALAKLLTPAYTAEDFVVVCGLDDKDFIAKTTGPLGNTFDYVQHVKEEVLANISPDEAQEVVRHAADAARSTGRQQLKELSPLYPRLPVNIVQSWCREYGVKFVRHFISEHDSEHKAFMNRVTEAKLRQSS